MGRSDEDRPPHHRRVAQLANVGQVSNLPL
jgi:hypothetical protein